MLKNKHVCFRQSEDTFVKWLIQILGPVILGAKPAEILSFSKNNTTSPEKLNKINYFFGNCRKISYKMFHCNNSTKVLFYAPVSLDATLLDVRNAKFLKSIGYPNDYNLEAYLSHMIHKFQSNGIPDEIGIFLGYPLKDVLGFIGHPSLKLTKVNGWRVYGDSALSDQIFNDFLTARNKINEILNYEGLEKVLSFA